MNYYVVIHNHKLENWDRITDEYGLFIGNEGRCLFEASVQSRKNLGPVYGVISQNDYDLGLEPEYLFIRGAHYRLIPEGK